MTINELVALANAGFTKSDIMQLAGIGQTQEPAPAVSPAPAPEPAQAPETAPSNQPVSAMGNFIGEQIETYLNPIAEQMKKLVEAQQINNTLSFDQPRKPTVEDSLAKFLPPNFNPKEIK